MRRSRREIERALEGIDEDSEDDSITIVIRSTVVGTEYSASDLEPGETETTERVVEI
ncbi:MAG: hypothetical protein ACOCY1_06235 [Halovenus sp.]